MEAVQNTLLLIEKEVRDARRNRWFLIYALVFAGLSLAVAWTALSGAGAYGMAGFGRTSVGLVNLVLLVVPLMGLTLGSLSVVQERERSTLLYLLSQPLSFGEVFLGKALGVGLALSGALALGFGVAGLVMALRAGVAQVSTYLLLLGLSVLLAWACLSVGVLISSLARRTATALGVALFLWLFLVFFSDLGLIGTAIALKLPIKVLFWASLLNPLQAFKVSAVLSLKGSIDVLGPVGQYAVRHYGSVLQPMLVGFLLAWVVLPLLVGFRVFRSRGGV